MILKKLKTGYLLGGISLITLIIPLLLSVTACHKNTECSAAVTVVDSVGKPLANASVTLWYNSTASGGKTQITTTQVTDGTGATTFVFKLQAIYDVDVTYLGVKKQKLGIIKLEPGQSVSKTIVYK